MFYLEGEEMQRDQGLVSVDSTSQGSSVVIRMNKSSKSWLRSWKLRKDALGKRSHLLNQVRMFVVRDVRANLCPEVPFPSLS